MKQDRKGIDFQEVQFQPLKKKEARALKMHEANKTYEQIRLAVYPDLSRQAIWDIIKRAKRKLWSLDAPNRWAHDPAACPVDELPLPPRIRNSLHHAGYDRIGQLAGMTLAQLRAIKGPEGPGKPRGLGKASSLIVYELVKKFGLRGSSSYCPKCGAQIHKKVNGEAVTLTCGSCGAEVKVQHVNSGQANAAA